MNIHQISVFLENRTGQLAEITRLLADNGIDLRAISIAETADYGLARMIVDDSHKASSILLQHGDILSMTPVWAVEVPDRAGGLAEVLGLYIITGSTIIIIATVLSVLRVPAMRKIYLFPKKRHLLWDFGCFFGKRPFVV